MNKTVVVGMSGGVDSSVAAFLLKEQGYHVIGVTMQMWQSDRTKMLHENCCSTGECGISGASCLSSAVEDASKVAEALNIPYYVMDFQQEFQEQVINHFVNEYLNGRTPNPCVVCNRYVKWEALLRRSAQLGADYIATGHYARIDKLPGGRYAIRNSVTASKDQTYALYNLTQNQLACTLMPVGEYEKERIRQIAKEAGIPVANKPDSQEICFVPDNDYAGFIDRQAGALVPPPGNFVTVEGKVLGTHKGITHYTIGQRRGLDLPMGERVFVTEIRPDTNEVVIGKNEDIFTETLICDRVNFMAISDLQEPMRVLGKVRYNHRGEYCMIEKLQDGRVKATFEKPVRAVTPGQVFVFYDGEYVVGGGTIVGC